MSEKGLNWETVYQSCRPQDLDDMGKAKLLEVQWQVGDPILP